jgi:paraquat-inducible protein B
MSKAANKTVVGVFVVGAVALVVLAVAIFGSGTFLAKRLQFVIFFPGDVRGLNIGSPVMFRGVRIGSVADISLQVRPEDLAIFIPVIIEIDQKKVTAAGVPGKPYENLERLVDRGLRAQLQIQSFVTGQLTVALDFLPNTPVTLVGLDKAYHEIPAVPSAMEALSDKLEKMHIEELVGKLRAILDATDKVVESPDLARAIQAIAATAEETRTLVRNLNEHIPTLGPRIEGTVKDTQELVRGVEARLDAVGKALEALTATLQEAQTAIHSFVGVAGPGSPLAIQLTSTLEETSKAVRSLRALADYIEQHPEALVRGKPASGGD